MWSTRNARNSAVAVVTAAAFCVSTFGAENPSPRSILIDLPVQPAQFGGVLAMDLDVWRIALQEGVVELCVSPDELAELWLRGFEPVVVDEDVYATWAAQQIAFAGRDGPWEQYHNLDSTNAFLADLHAAYPDITEPFVPGMSVENRPINGIRISGDPAQIDPSKPAVFIVGCHHAREWISVEVPLYLAEKLCEGYSADPEIRRLIHAGEIWIVPVVNVDGYLYTEINRMWRKNRRYNGNNTWGIDLNRNYSYEWGGGGSSSNPGSETYRGPSPFSEPETAAVRDLHDLREFSGGLTYHSYGQLVMCPWGHTTAPPPNNVVLEAMVADMAAILNSFNPPGGYVSGRWGVALYIGSGITVDWWYGVHDIPGAIIELRPKNSGGGGFLLPPDQILPTCIENVPTALYLIHDGFGFSTVGDVNCDGVADFGDINPFVLALTDPVGYAAAHPDCSRHNADVNADGEVDFGDINPFVDVLTAP